MRIIVSVTVIVLFLLILGVTIYIATKSRDYYRETDKDWSIKNESKLYIICDINTLQYFIEYINSILYKIDRRFVEIISVDKHGIYEWFYSQLESDDINHNIYIFLKEDYDIIELLDSYNGNNIFIINTEQLSRNNCFQKINKLRMEKCKIIDYSLENCSIINDSIYLPYQVNDLEIYNYDKVNDICFIGSSSEYRRYILDKFFHKKINITEIIDWGESRDLFLFKHKILVNLHYDEDYNINEEMRVNRCVFNKMIVISQSGLNDDLLYLKDYIIFCEYEDIVEKTIEVLTNYKYYHDKIFKNFDLEKIDAYYEKYMVKAFKEIFLKCLNY